MKSQWLHFTADFDYRWPSMAVTAFKADMKVYVKGDVAKAALEAGVAKRTSKPDHDDPKRVSSPSRLESKRPKVLSGNPVLTNVVMEAPPPSPATPTPPPDGSVSEEDGAALSAAGGGEQKLGDPDTLQTPEGEARDEKGIGTVTEEKSE